MSESTNTGLSDDDVLFYTQKMRKKLVDHITDDGAKMPSDNSTASLMLQALSDMDRTAIGKKKLVIEQGQSEADRLASQIIAQLARDTKTANTFILEGEFETVNVDVSQLPSISMVPGVTNIGVEENDYDSFYADMDEKDAAKDQQDK